MTTEAGKETSFHPEGLTPAQETLADMLIETKISAKVKRRKTLLNGKFGFEDVTRPTSPFDFAQEGEFALKLHENHPEAPLSPYYINLRSLPPELNRQIGVVLSEIPTDVTPDCCAGIPDAGTPLITAYADASGVPLVDIFVKEQTPDGKRRIVIKPGVRGEGKKLRIGDDVITEAGTKVEAIDAAERAGFKVVDILVVIDREQGGKEELERRGHKLRAAFTVTQLLDNYRRKDKINKVKYDESKAYLASGKR